MILIIILAVVIIIWLVTALKACRLTKNNVVCFVGGLGSGKSYLTVTCALRRYRRLYIRYLLGLLFGKVPLLKNYFPRMIKPSIYSNIPVKISRKKWANPLKYEHLIMSETLPENAILIIDEIGQFATQYDYDNPKVMECLQVLIRFYRHFTNGYIFCNDQSSDNIVKQIRVRINVIYNLSNMRRWFGILPFFKVDCDELKVVEDTIVNLNDITEDKSLYFFGSFPYRWQKKKMKYASRCYKNAYTKGFEKNTIWLQRNDMTTESLIDLSSTKEERKRYKDTH